MPRLFTGHRRRARIFVAIVLLAQPAVSRAADAPVLSAPLPAAHSSVAAGRSDLHALDAAVAAGLPSLVETLGADALKNFAADPVALRRVRLALADARLQRSDYAAAGVILAEIPGGGADKSLRLALAAAGEKRFGEAATALAAAPRAQLAGADPAWFDIVTGLLAAEGARAAEAEHAFAAAKTAAAGNRLLADQVEMLRQRASLRMNLAVDFADTVNPLPDARQSYQLAKNRAGALAAGGKYPEAINALRSVAIADADLLAERDLLVGLLYGKADGDSAGRDPQGRESLLAAVRAEGRPAVQAAALAALRRAVITATPGETLANANAVYSPLTDYLDPERKPAARPDSAVADMIHFVRADIMFETAMRLPPGRDREDALARASDAARILQEKFPASPLRADALALTAQVSRHTKAYRRAADAYDSLVSILPAARRAEFRLAAADCYFLSGDHALAAGAYDAALGLGISDPKIAGDVLIDRTRALLADKNDKDRFAKSASGLLAVNAAPAGARLRAEWLLADAQREANAFDAALGRVNAALPRAANDTGMRIRFLWLRAMLELATRKNSAAKGTAEEVAALVKTAPDAGELTERNRPRILAQAALLRARALLGESDESGARSAFEELRLKYPEESSSADSYLDEGFYMASLGDHATALDVFKKGYEKIKDNRALAENAANLLFEGAKQALELAAERDPDKRLETAFNLLDTLAARFEKSKLYFRARLLQGDTLRRMNSFDAANKVYLDLISGRPDDPDRRLAELAKADCLLEKGGRFPDGNGQKDPTENYALAAADYDRLLNLPGRAASLAAEAGYKRAVAVSSAPAKGVLDRVAGEKLARDEAAKGLWQNITLLLGSPAESAALDDNGRWWLAKSFLLISDLCEKNGDTSGARAALTRLVEYNAGLKKGQHRLPGEDTALLRIGLLTGTPAAKP